METLPSELVLNVLRFVTNITDKCQLSITCRRIHNLLSSNPWCWSPLDLSHHGDRITNSTLVSILRNCAIRIKLPGEAPSPTTPSNNPSYDVLRTIQHVNLSGCWCLTPEALCMVACSLPQLTRLELNRYGSTTELWPFEQRDHLYQMRPSHNLSSLAMDMSKVPSMSLTLSESTLQYIVGQCTRIESLSLRYQNLGIAGCRAIERLPHLTQLDISSCAITQPVLQKLLKSCGRQLLSLKMLNIDLTNFTLLCMQQHAKELRQLHVSCQDPQILVGIVHVLERFEKLEDFRLTQLRTGGNVDVIVEKLNPATLRRLDLSPKLDFHPRFPKSSTATGGGPRLVSACTSPPGTTPSRRRSPSPNNGNTMHLFNSNKKDNSGSSSSPTITHNNNDNKSSASSQQLQQQQQQQQKKLQLKQLQQQLPRTEHQLYLTDQSLATLCNFKGLVELRLCYPVVSKPALTELFTCVPNLEILELRMEMRKAAACSSPPSSSGSGGRFPLHSNGQLQQKKKKQQQEEEKLWEDQDEKAVDVLRGLLPINVPKLRELALYHSWISVVTARQICSFDRLRELTIYNCGKIVDREPELVRRWLSSLPLLQVLRLGRMGHIRCDLMDDIATPNDILQSKHISRPDDEFIFTHHSFLSGQWKWSCINN
ncbi:hypothetical protein BDA99DRAFT_494737 [Phascolomyces articulosus]|uniref:F-box domain-containing protein n=1 Tax=Phascolomyces articulosus TaxID=60185 RepID=A0AAD5KBF6_9FUNG|nr:hypothetical protein BDA99DRAFT_494737 [Phascolomyces articulosus]